MADEEPTSDAPPEEEAPPPASETQLTTPQPDTGDEAGGEEGEDEGLPPPAPGTDGIDAEGEAVIKAYPSLRSQSMVEGQKTPEPDKEPNFEDQRSMIYSESKKGLGFSLPNEYGVKDYGGEPLKSASEEFGEPMADEDEGSKEHELEVMRSLIYEERQEHGFQLPSEYGPHGLGAPDIGPGARLARAPKNIAQQILDVLGGREAYPGNECDKCMDDRCDDEDSIMNSMADLVLAVVEAVAERLFKPGEECKPLAETISQGINAISNAVSKQNLGDGASEAVESMSNMMKKSMAEIASAVSQKASQMESSLQGTSKALSEKASAALSQASKVASETASAVKSQVSKVASETATGADSAPEE